MKNLIRRVDHLAVAVASTERALEYFHHRLGLDVVHVEELANPRVKLTYLDAGNMFIQLVEPLDDASDVAVALAERGEGVDHICFAVDDPLVDAQALSNDGVPPTPGTGRGRTSAFVPGTPVHGLRIECTKFDLESDVEGRSGWLDTAEERH